jgi:hypothetical protein
LAWAHAALKSVEVLAADHWDSAVMLDELGYHFEELRLIRVFRNLDLIDAMPS